MNDDNSILTTSTLLNAGNNELSSLNNQMTTSMSSQVLSNQLQNKELRTSASSKYGSITSINQISNYNNDQTGIDVNNLNEINLIDNEEYAIKQNKALILDEQSLADSKATSDFFTPQSSESSALDSIEIVRPSSPGFALKTIAKSDVRKKSKSIRKKQEVSSSELIQVNENATTSSSSTNRQKKSKKLNPITTNNLNKIAVQLEKEKNTDLVNNPTTSSHANKEENLGSMESASSAENFDSFKDNDGFEYRIALIQPTKTSDVSNNESSSPSTKPV